jgi:hypothetical protein
MPKIEQLKELMKLVNQDHFSYKEGAKLFKALIQAIKDTKEQLSSQSAKDKKDMMAMCDQCVKVLETKLEASIKAMKAEKEGEYHQKHKATIAEIVGLKAKLQDIADSIPSETDLSEVWAEINKKVIPSLEEIIGGVEKQLPKYGTVYRDGLELLKGDDRLDKAAIRGIEDLEAEIKKAKEVRVVGGGGNKAVFMYIDGVKKGLMNSFNLAAGEGVAIAHSKVNGLDTFTFTTASPTVTVTTPTGTINSVNTVFTVTAEPKFVVADGTTYFANAGYTYAALSITMDIAPSSSIRAII